MCYLQVHPVHRRLAELAKKSNTFSQMDKLTQAEQMDVIHCLKLNASMIERLDQLNNMLDLAQRTNDVEWQHEICGKIDELAKAWR